MNRRQHPEEMRGLVGNNRNPLERVWPARPVMFITNSGEKGGGSGTLAEAGSESVGYAFHNRCHDQNAGAPVVKWGDH